jgi:hypothetical protein
MIVYPRTPWSPRSTLDIAERDGAMKHGMTEGMAQRYAALDRVLAT